MLRIIVLYKDEPSSQSFLLGLSYVWLPKASQQCVEKFREESAYVMAYRK